MDTRSLARKLEGERRTLPELADQLFLDVGDVAAKHSRFWVLLVLSAVIATAGVLTDSTATVIGAMIIAPLGTPIMGVALAIVTGKPRRLAASLVTVVLGALSVVLLAWALALVLPELRPLAQNSQVTGRTSPGLIDLVAAVATGFAGAYGLARKDVSDVMPGVAIAISLVPPLAVVGITAQAGDFGGAFGAFLLFVSNVLAMIVAGSVLFTVYGYGREARRATEFHRRGAYVVLAAATLLVALPLTITTAEAVRRQGIAEDANRIAREWATGTDTVIVQTSFEGGELDVTVLDLDDLPPGDLAARLAGEVPAGTPVVVNHVAGRRVEVGRVPAPAG